MSSNSIYVVCTNQHVLQLKYQPCCKIVLHSQVKSIIEEWWYPTWNCRCIRNFENNLLPVGSLRTAQSGCFLLTYILVGSVLNKKKLIKYTISILTMSSCFMKSLAWNALLNSTLTRKIPIWDTWIWHKLTVYTTHFKPVMVANYLISKWSSVPFMLMINISFTIQREECCVWVVVAP